MMHLMLGMVATISGASDIHNANANSSKSGSGWVYLFGISEVVFGAWQIHVYIS